MKLRIHGNSVRLRLSRTDMQTFAQNGLIQDAIQFAPESRLSYALQCAPSVEEVQVQYEHGVITILIPVQVAREWMSSDEVGISSTGAAGPSLLIEKDFRCLHREQGQAQDDAFPNPLDCVAHGIPSALPKLGES
jgi:hypothetical protein